MVRIFKITLCSQCPSFNSKTSLCCEQKAKVNGDNFPPDNCPLPINSAQQVYDKIATEMEAAAHGDNSATRKSLPDSLMIWARQLRNTRNNP